MTTNKQRLFTNYIEVNSIINQKQMQQNNDNLNFTDNDYKFIERLSKNNYIF
jgi:hypothetical protein